jgi:uncharacterized protein (TIGR02145 family)
VKKFFVLLTVAALFVACGDESSSSAPDPIGEISSSSNDDNGSASSSSQKDSKKSSSSVAEKNSSSSVSGMNSSSSVVESSSSGEFHLCENGDTLISEGLKKITYFECVNNDWVVKYIIRKDSLDSLAAIEKNKEHPNMDSLFAGYDGEYLEFEDPRDGRKYKYFEFDGSSDFGSYATFYVMAENLNYGKMVHSSTTKFDDEVTEKMCYVDDEWFCDNHFGGLYTWAEAMNLPKVCDSVAVDSNDACKAITEKRGSYPGEEYLNIIWQGICPDGWHIMNQREWRYVHGDIRSNILWKDNAGYNTAGLAIIPVGTYHPNGNSVFSGAREHVSIWISAEKNETNAYSISFFSSSGDHFLRPSSSTKGSFISVRCVMDSDNPLAQN